MIRRHQDSRQTRLDREPRSGRPATGHPYREYIELSGIQLLPHVQRQGIGTAVIEDLKAEAAKVALPLDLGVEKDNPNAQRLYERLGFVRVDETEQEFRLQWRPPPQTAAET